MAQGSSFSLCHPLPRAHGSTGMGRQFFNVDVSILLKTEQTVQRFLKKNKEAPRNDEGNNVDKALCIRLHYKLEHDTSFKCRSTARPLKTWVFQAVVSLQAFSWRVHGLSGVTAQNSRLCGVIKDGDRRVPRVCLQHFKVEECYGGSS